MHSLRILFLLSNLERGGIPRVTLNLVNELQRQGHIETAVFCGNPRGMFLEGLRQCGCSVLTGNLFLRALTCFATKEHGFFKCFFLAVKTLRYALLKLLHWDWLTLENHRVSRKLSSLGYDAVVATSEGLPSEWGRRVTGSQKILWIHNDYAHEPPADIEAMRQKLLDFDHIICVAEHVKTAFLTYFPECSPKTIALYNIVNEEEIHQKATEKIKIDSRFDTSVFSIVSIGRFNEGPKQFSAIPEICVELVQRGCRDFRWYLIGSGSPAETAIITDAVRQFGIEERVILLGEKSNPYPYLNQCSLFALTSRYEAYPTVINEALVLGTPIITTDFDGVEELVTPDMATIAPIGQFAEKIEDLMQLSKKGLLERHPHDFSVHNQRIIEKFCGMIAQCK